MRSCGGECEWVFCGHFEDVLGGGFGAGDEEVCGWDYNVGFLATYTWQVLLVTAIVYMVFLQFSLIAYQKRSVREAAKITDGVEMPDENEQEDKDQTSESLAAGKQA